MTKYAIMQKMYIEDQERSCWEEADPDAYTAFDPVDAVMKCLVVHGENFRWCENLEFHWCGDLCKVYYTDDEGRLVELDFAAKEIAE